MPLGVVCAQVTHAAGDSAVGFSLQRWYQGPVTAVVLGVRDEKQLKYYWRRLEKAEISHTLVVEDAGPFAGQATAIGVMPTEDREKVFKVLKKLNPLSDLRIPNAFCDDFYTSDLHVIEECFACTKLLNAT